MDKNTAVSSTTADISTLSQSVASSPVQSALTETIDAEVTNIKSSTVADKNQQSLIPTDDSIKIQTVVSDANQQSTLLSEDNTPVPNSDTSIKTAEASPRFAVSNDKEKSTLKSNPVIALGREKDTTVTTQLAIDRLHQKKRGFKKTEKTTTFYEQLPAKPDTDDKMNVNLFTNKPLQISENFIPKHVSPHFYADVINSVQLRIAPETNNILPPKDPNHFISHVDSGASFSGYSSKRISAHRITTKSEPKATQYVFASVTPDQIFSGQIAKRSNLSAVTDLHSNVPQYMFAGERKNSNFSGSVHKRSSQYIQ